MNHDRLCTSDNPDEVEDCSLCSIIDIVRKEERDKVSGSAIWQITLDEATNTAYMWTTPEEILDSRGGVTIQRDAYLDLDAKGRVVGVEIFDWPALGFRGGRHQFIMDAEFDMCKYCGALLESIQDDGIHWYRKEGDNG